MTLFLVQKPADFKYTIELEPISLENKYDQILRSLPHLTTIFYPLDVNSIFYDIEKYFG